MIRVLIADDHTLVRESLASAIDASPGCHIVAQCADGISAIEQAHALRPDLAIVDISMPRLSGMEVVRRLHAELPRTRVLVLTMHEEEEYVVPMVRAGASGYLVKHAAVAELLEAIRAIAAGGVYFGSYASKALAEHVRQPDADSDPYGTLSPREREVFHLIVDGLTTKEIARRLDISTKTAENHRLRILAKLDVRNAAELVRYAARKRLID
ncbi:response regulator [Tahibacter amnicola]|uniref:Response regulator transcription factor n=1 Tax=Tahibacter amnicola TaxID=2976241 RepID=A0ABY6BCL0_9GAMM|nr:response regulator transcription factor [Tahibacter amnicola]UXI67547.1 response regulator transcription factor [Tahibacter amnicola]